MSISEIEKSLLEQIIAEYGDEEVKSSQVTKELSSKHLNALMKYGQKKSHGVYSLVDYDINYEKTQSAPVVEDIAAYNNSQITDFIHNENLIPEVDSNYIEFGCYRPVLRIVKGMAFLPFYITGESGNGKTLGVEQACANSNRELVCVNITNETTEEDLMGSFILKDGNMVWKDGPVLVAMRRGAVLLLDEIDQATTAIMCLQTVLQNKPYYVKKTNEMVYPKTGFTIVATSNTLGDGEGGDRFIGANVLNEAFLERFNCVFFQDYPPVKVEMEILSKISTNNKFLVSLVRWASLIRENYKANSIERCITTRRLVQIVRNFEIFKNEMESINYAVSRFGKATKDAMLDYYQNINQVTYNDGLDKYLGK